VYAGIGNDALYGGLGADTFTFAGTALNGSDLVNGGTGTALDAIVFTSGTTQSATTLQHVSHVEQLMLANATNSITLGDTLVGDSDANHTLYVYGGTGNDTVNGAAVTTAANKLYVSAGAGNDTLTGGAGADTFVFSTTDFNASDKVNGGAG